MATQKPISTISYNTEAFLREKLDNWVSEHLIQTYMYICHKGEDGDKDHIHLRIEPNKKLDPMDLTEKLKEFQLGKSKPLGVRPWRSSKEEDWFLYATHDKDYMKLKYSADKGEKLPYTWQDIRTSTDYDVEIAYIRAKQSLQHSSANLMSRITNGESASSLISLGENPYIVNALIQAARSNEFVNMQKHMNELKEELEQLLTAIDNYGLVVEYVDDLPVLKGKVEKYEK